MTLRNQHLVKRILVFQFDPRQLFNVGRTDGLDKEIQCFCPSIQLVRLVRQFSLSVLQGQLPEADNRK